MKHIDQMGVWRGDNISDWLKGGNGDDTSDAGDSFNCDVAVTTSEAKRWPTVDQAAYYGLAGDIVRTIEPHTEADPVGVLLGFITTFGNTSATIPTIRSKAIAITPTCSSFRLAPAPRGGRGPPTAA